jgi:hypothetical protein
VLVALFEVGVGDLNGVLVAILVLVTTEGSAIGLNEVVGNRSEAVGVVEVGATIAELEAMVVTTVDGAEIEEDEADGITAELGGVGSFEDGDCEGAAVGGLGGTGPAGALVGLGASVGGGRAESLLDIYLQA